MEMCGGFIYIFLICAYVHIIYSLPHFQEYIHTYIDIL